MVMIEATPIYSSPSNPAERYIKDIERQAIVTRLDAMARYGVNFTADHVIWPWLLMYCGFIRTRFHVQPNGSTGYRNVHGHDYNGELVPFLETVLFRVPKPHHRRVHGKTLHKADAKMVKGIYVGKHEESNEYLLLTENGLQRARTIRRMEPSKRADRELLSRVKGVPWATESRQLRAERMTAPVATPAAADNPEAGTGIQIPEVANPPSQPQAVPAAVGGAATTQTAAPVPAAVVTATVPPQVPNRPAPREGDTLMSPNEKKMRVGAITTCNTDEMLDESVIDLLVGLDAPATYVCPIEHAEQLRTGVNLALDRLALNDVYEDVPSKQAQGKKHISSRFENKWVWDEEVQIWIVKARFVGREFKWQEWMDDLFAPGAAHAYSRVIDHLSLREGLPTFIFDAVDAFYAAIETEECYVDPPVQYIENIRANGGDVDIMWRLKRQLPGRRRAAQGWAEHLAQLLINRGFQQSAGHPQFFVKDKPRIGLEAHMDDGHGFGEPSDVVALLLDL